MSKSKLEMGEKLGKGNLKVYSRRFMTYVFLGKA